MSEKSIRVILADDHNILLEGLCSLFQDEPEIEIVGVGNNGKEVLEIVDERPVDVVITDIDMPEMDGVELCKQLYKSHPQIRVLAFTLFVKPTIIQRMMNSGAAGYILKSATKDELIEGIKTVVEGGIYIPDEILKRVFIKPDQAPTKESNYGKDLTRRELEILNLIAQELTINEIAELLSLSPNTIISHRKKIMKKLNARNSAGMIRKAIESGLLD
ncbi:MAG: response regulator transcription factor [Bacteroidota bacterium]